jgi:hypothetical protein
MPTFASRPIESAERADLADAEPGRCSATIELRNRRRGVASRRAEMRRAHRSWDQCLASASVVKNGSKARALGLPKQNWRAPQQARAGSWGWNSVNYRPIFWTVG